MLRVCADQLLLAHVTLPGLGSSTPGVWERSTLAAGLLNRRIYSKIDIYGCGTSGGWVTF
jgi:hypothetical protein